MGLGKTFPLWSGLDLKFRADAFNVTNHPNFSVPTVGPQPPGLTGTDITDSTVPFGNISQLVSTTNDPYNSGNAPRVLQVALRLEF